VANRQCRGDLGGDARASAVAAERLSDRCDHADLAAAVAIPPAPGDLAAIVLLGRLERELGADQRHDLRSGDDVVERQPFVAPTSMYSMKRRM
jgi:hypothetical protein